MPRQNYEPVLELACPHDGWYNGNPKLMIQNGTYADYRFRLEEWVRKAKMTQQELAMYDQMWASIPLEEKVRRRNSIVSSLEFKPKKMKDGTVEMVTTPSDNGAAKVKEPQFRKKLVHRQALGSIVNRPNPLMANAPMQGAAPQGMLPPQQMGRPVPALAPQMRPPVQQAPTLQQQLSPAAMAAA